MGSRIWKYVAFAESDGMEMCKHHQVNDVNVESGTLNLTVDEKQNSIPLSNVSHRLAQATPENLKLFEISSSGYEIHWPLIDEDISIDALLGIRHERGQKRNHA